MRINWEHEGLPCHRKRDGSIVFSGKNYTAYKKLLWERQEKRCRICSMYLPWPQAELDHLGGRGMAGGKRDDRNVRVVHHDCHSEYHWRTRDAKASFDKRVNSIVEWAEKSKIG